MSRRYYECTIGSQKWIYNQTSHMLTLIGYGYKAYKNAFYCVFFSQSFAYRAVDLEEGYPMCRFVQE